MYALRLLKYDFAKYEKKVFQGQSGIHKVCNETPLLKTMLVYIS